MFQNSGRQATLQIESSKCLDEMNVGTGEDIS